MINGMDRSQVIQTINDAWLAYEAQKNGTVQADTPLLRMESAAAKVLKDFQAISLTIYESQMRWAASDVSQAIAAVEDGAVVPGGTYDKGRWLELEAAYQSFATWLQTPIEGVDRTPGAIVFRDYMPPTPPQE